MSDIVEIKGTWMTSDGFIDSHGILLVERVLDTRGKHYWRSPQTGSELYAHQYAVTHDIMGWEITGDDTAWHFSPEDPDQLKRIGFTIREQG